MKLKISVFLAVVSIGLVQCQFEIAYQWKELKYNWESVQKQQDAIRSGQYKPENNLPLGIEIWKNKFFITVPRWKSGVASSLNYFEISNDQPQSQSPVLTPYPSWKTNTVQENNVPGAESRIGGHDNAGTAEVSTEALADNATIISTFRVRVDKCDRLWAMDTGLADILGSPKQVAPPALVIFDLNTDKLIRRYVFPPSDLKADTFFANVVVEITGQDCDNAYAYIPDLGAYGLVVYSFKENKSWRIKHNFFHFDPLNGDYNVGGINFQWTDGVFGIALGSIEKGTRPVYFHALSSTKEFTVPNYVLQNQTRATSMNNYFDYQVLGDRGPNGQASASVFDEKTKVLFYTQVNKDSVQCWNAANHYTPETQGIVKSDSDALEFPNDLKVDDADNLWILSDKMPRFLFSKLDGNKFNYKILKGKIPDILQGTGCEPKQK